MSAASNEDHQRAVTALNLKLAGVDWDTIADRLGFADPVDAIDAAQEVAATHYDGQSIDPALILEVLRLDKLHTVAWKEALKGDLNAARLALDIGDRRQRLLRVNQRSRD
ncbi:hypothetical protein [Streptomyces sp. NRRL S-350]|uniref:hypothetical protein n=1 Tax=Streptomyces sp. NRRL S-350 TaxID=1463902 RepID=UPI0004BFC71D|nr:hypothetical protein [Streptomyces sp. NRRL S-350]